MINSDIADILNSFAKLSELHNGNPFKIKSFQNAAFQIDKLTKPIALLSLNEIENIPGIGKSIAKVVFNLVQTNSFDELENLIAQTPKGVLDMMKIKGLGPKKIAYIWKDLGIESVGELLYACKENRLAQAKGFGLKTQQNVLAQIEFMQRNANKFHYYKAYQAANELLLQLKNLPFTIEICGALRRKEATIECIEFVVGSNQIENITNAFKNSTLLTNIVFEPTGITANLNEFPVVFYLCLESEFAYHLLKHTGNNAHLELIKFNTIKNKAAYSELELYKQLGIKYIEPELREGLFECNFLTDKSIKLIDYTDLKGSIHNHSKWSDGLASIEEMAKFCMQQGWQYFGIADHSKAAYYANGLNEEQVLAQHKEIDALNKKLTSFKIFKGIECDILNDGSLDYSNDFLSLFDYVVASVHSNLKMDEEKAMKRLIKAIENPNTTILGHATGRLLLLREGYPINHHKIIDACAANGVCIELNANPYRLDMDWHYLPYALEKGVYISINPDAHEPEGLLDMHWGIAVARKGLLTAQQCLNALNATEIENYFKQKQPK
jgi:DNA polymerase (family 10)